MGDFKNLSNAEAIAKLKDLAESIQTCMFCTYNDNTFESRPMSVQQVDAEGNLWFMSDKSSRKNRTIMKDARVELLFASGHEKFLSVHGTASISYDREKIKELWEPIVKVWFTEGVDDPNISVIKVDFDNGYYWDTKHGSMISFAKMAASLLTGKTMDDGIEGNLS